MNLVGISGSLRAESVHTRLLRTCAAHLPEGVDFSIVGFRDLPLFDADLEEPPAVAALKVAIQAADAVLFACPEYNHGIPGGLKNALDWASRPAFQSVFASKPCGMFSAANSPVGGVRAQAQLREVLHGMLARVYPGRELSFGKARTLFVDGALNSEGTRRLERYLHGLVHWADTP